MTLWSEIREPVHEALEQVFGETVTYQRSGIADQNVTAIYSDGYERVTGPGETDVQSVSPSYYIRTDQFVAGFSPSQGDVIETDAGLTYEVVEVMPDQDGGWKLAVMELD